MSGLFGPRRTLWPEARRFGPDGVPAGSTVIVRRRPLVQRPGSTQLVQGDWRDAGEHEVDGVGLDRMVSTDAFSDTGSAQQQVATIFGPTDADIARGDRVVFPNGVVVEVSGIPSREPNMINGWTPPMTAAVTVTHG